MNILKVGSCPRKLYHSVFSTSRKARKLLIPDISILVFVCSSAGRVKIHVHILRFGSGYFIMKSVL